MDKENLAIREEAEESYLDKIDAEYDDNDESDFGEDPTAGLNKHKQKVLDEIKPEKWAKWFKIWKAEKLRKPGFLITQDGDSQEAAIKKLQSMMAGLGIHGDSV